MVARGQPDLDGRRPHRPRRHGGIHAAVLLVLGHHEPPQLVVAGQAEGEEARAAAGAARLAETRAGLTRRTDGPRNPRKPRNHPWSVVSLIPWIPWLVSRQLS